MAWWYIVVFIAALFIASSMKPKANSKPPSSMNLDVPTAEEGRPIPVLFGTRDIKSPNILWYGGVRTTDVKSQGGGKK